jgi:hypothetical protein
MKNLKLTAILALVLFLAGATVAGATSMLYVDTYNSSTGVSSLYTVSTIGVATYVGDIKLGGTTNLGITDIAYNPTTQTMYAVSSQGLYTLDHLHPSGTIITANAITLSGGNAGSATRLQGLEVSSGGIIYTDNTFKTAGSNRPGHLFSITSSGVVSDLNSNGTSGTTGYIGNYGDLVFVGSTLYGTFAVNGSTDVYLGTVNTGNVNPNVSNLMDTGINNLDGLAYLNSTLYGISRTGTLYTISTSDGSLSNSHDTGLSGVYGMTFALGVPLPPSVFLLGTGLLGIGLLGFRRKAG